MFSLDVNPEEAYKRIALVRDRREMFESMEELRRIRHKALCLALTDRWTVINANKSQEVIAKELREHVLPL